MPTIESGTHVTLCGGGWVDAENGRAAVGPEAASAWYVHCSAAILEGATMNAQNRLGRIGCYGAGIVGVLGLTAFPVSACQLDPGDVVITDIGARSVVEIDAGTGRSCPISVGGLLELPVGLADRNDKPGKLTERPFGLSRSAAADFEMGDGASCGSSR